MCRPRSRQRWPKPPPRIPACATRRRDCSFLSGVTGAEVPLDHPLWTGDAARRCRRGTGAAPEINPLHTSSDIRNPMVQSGIPCVGLGPLCGDLTQNGGRDEWVDAADYVRGVGVVAR